MTARAVDAVNALARQYPVSDWIEPRDGASHRDVLQRVAAGDDLPPMPHFAYVDGADDRYLVDIEQTRRLVADELGARRGDRDLLDLVVGHLDELASRARAIAARDDRTYSAVVARLDGLPDPAVIAEAHAVLAEPIEPAPPADLTADHAAEVLRRALVRLEIEEPWTVELHEAMSATMSVNGPARRVRVRADATFSQAQVDRLVVHEIGGHVLRWARSRTQPEPLASLPLGRTVATEEGLALWSEERAGLLDARTMRVYAARVIAVDLAQRAGISEVARVVAEHVGPEQAAAIAMRAKRGLIDPEAPGGSTKDWGYLGGLLQSRRLAATDPVGLRLLLGVKWSAEHLDVVKTLATQGRLVPFEPLHHRDLVATR